jgi:hypothetical protein
MFQTFSSSATPFAIYVASINPGLGFLFPWLHNVAVNFEKYRFRRLRFRYVPAVSTITSGTVALAVDPDASDDLPTSIPAMLSFQNACAVNTWMGCDINTQSSALAEVRYIRSGSVADTDVKLYDLGNFLYGTTTTVTNSPGDLGYMFVDYEVDLINPAAHIDENAEAESFVLKSQSTVDYAPFAGAERFGDLPIQVGQNFLQFNRIGSYNLALKAGAYAPGKVQTDLIDDTLTTVGWGAVSNASGGVQLSVDNFSSANNFLVEVTESFQRLYTNFTSALQGMAAFTNVVLTVAPLFAAILDPSETLVWHPAKKAGPPVQRCIAVRIPPTVARQRIAAMRSRSMVTSSSTTSSSRMTDDRDREEKRRERERGGDY